MIENIETTEIEIQGDIIVIPSDPITISVEQFSNQLESRIVVLEAQKLSIIQALNSAYAQRQVIS